MRSVVITGTSTGIGWGTAKVLIANGFRVFGSVRKTSDAERLAAAGLVNNAGVAVAGPLLEFCLRSRAKAARCCRGA